MTKPYIDNGTPFDWNKISENYVRYRNIYPKEFLKRFKGIYGKGIKTLDIGTGTGVLPLALYEDGAKITGVDPAEKQIEEAKRICSQKGVKADFICSKAEEIQFAPESFDAATACQCFWYLSHEELSKKIFELLKDNGIFVAAVMNWLPLEDKIVSETEELILKYNPNWVGAGEIRHKIEIPECYHKYFDIVNEEVFDLDIPFTRETWNGRIMACRGTGAALSKEKADEFQKEHLKLLSEIAPEEFKIKHYAAFAVMRKKELAQ